MRCLPPGYAKHRQRRHLRRRRLVRFYDRASAYAAYAAQSSASSSPVESGNVSARREHSNIPAPSDSPSLKRAKPNAVKIRVPSGSGRDSGMKFSTLSISDKRLSSSPNPADTRVGGEETDGVSTAT